VTAFYAEFSSSDAISDGLLEEARSLIGVPLRVDQWNTEASVDNIRHYALGIGDLNPLWQDVEYARSSVHRGIVAPPTFLYSVYCGLAPGLGGLAALHQGVRWQFHDWIRLGDQLRAAAQLTDATMTVSKRGHRRIKQFGRIEYSVIQATGGQRLVAQCDQTVIRTPGPGQPDALAYEPRDEHQYTVDELSEIGRAVLSVKQRGAETRYWDDVECGDVVDQVVKGPYTRMSMVCYYAGAPGSPGYRAFDAWWRNRHLATTAPESIPNTFDPAYFAGTGVSSMGHHDAGVAHTIGMPGIYDNGNQRIGLMATPITNWMGDEGFLYEYNQESRRPVLLGDTLYIDGTVVDKSELADGDSLAFNVRGDDFGQAKLELKARNQLGDVVATGGATVLLRLKKS